MTTTTLEEKFNNIPQRYEKCYYIEVYDLIECFDEEIDVEYLKKVLLDDGWDGEEDRFISIYNRHDIFQLDDCDIYFKWSSCHGSSRQDLVLRNGHYEEYCRCMSKYCYLCEDNLKEDLVDIKFDDDKHPEGSIEQHKEKFIYTLRKIREINKEERLQEFLDRMFVSIDKPSSFENESDNESVCPCDCMCCCDCCKCGECEDCLGDIGKCNKICDCSESDEE